MLQVSNALLDLTRSVGIIHGNYHFYVVPVGIGQTINLRPDSSIIAVRLHQKKKSIQRSGTT